MKKPKRKLVVSGLSDCMKQLRAALDEIDGQKAAFGVLLEQKDKMQDELEAERRRRFGAEEEAKKTREHFNDLKTRLHNAELETSRLKGFMERVREDDNIADPLVEVTGPNGTHQVSKRWPSNAMQAMNGATIGCDYATDAYGRQQKKEHWITY